jgi:Tfp pilus assembly protein PilF
LGDLEEELLEDNPRAELDMGLKHHKEGRLAQAEKIYRKVLSTDPKNAEALHLMGLAAHHGDRNEQAIQFITSAIKNELGNVKYYNNLGIVYLALDKNEDATECFRDALEIDPNSTDAHFNLGLIMTAREDYEEAIKFFRCAINLDPQFSDAHYNLSIVLTKCGYVEEVVESYQKVLAIQPDYPDAWYGMKNALKALHFSNTKKNKKSIPSQLGLSPAARETLEFVLLEYFLDSFKPHQSDESFRKAIAAFPPKKEDEIPILDTNRGPAISPFLPDKLVALFSFGRSGTGLLHSLIDGHPEISTLPSIYLQGYFSLDVWNKMANRGWRGLPERFVEDFAVLFDANSPYPTPSRKTDNTSFLGKKEGMANVGENRNESLSLDKHAFCDEANQLLETLDKVDPKIFLMVIHAAFEKVMRTKKEKKTVFYHIHCPENFTKLNFLRYVPDARLVMMIREPIQSCESWIRVLFNENKYNQLIYRIIGMLFAIDQIAFRTQDSIGVRLEDIKKQPKATMLALCSWLGVEEAPSLYHMTAQGKKWWGDPSSPDYEENKEMSPFDKSSIKRSVGAIFSDRDQLVLQTLFYPFSVRFNYREPNQTEFENNLKKIRPLFDDMFDFERALVKKSNIDPAQFKRSIGYVLLRASFMDRWEVLCKFKDYPNMIPPLHVTSE